MAVPNTDVRIFCDVSTSNVRSFVTLPFRKTIFETLQCLLHPGIKATLKLVTQRYVLPSVRTDVRRWSRPCMKCLRANITKHMISPIGTFQQPFLRFQHVHIDIIVMPPSEGYRYCLTCVDRNTRWPEVTPLANQE